MSDDLFYRGVPRCKECHKKAVRRNYTEKMMDPLWAEKELERQRMKTARRYAQGILPNPDRVAAGKSAWAIRNAHKVQANRLVKKAVDSGRLMKMPCEVCGCQNVQAHHDDYSKPLDVRWLCVKHHNEHHNNQRKQQRLSRLRLEVAA